ncbi:MAG: hypothetical protein H0V97_01695 [Actinobacteria bacterium]|nr:hypothetical protein [Actinomycetota bacterium]
MTSALDAKVGDFVASNRTFMVSLITKKLLTQSKERGRAPHALLSQLEKRIAKELSHPGRLCGNGLARYENHLKVIRLDAPVDRPIPSDLA